MPRRLASWYSSWRVCPLLPLRERLPDDALARSLLRDDEEDERLPDDERPLLLRDALGLSLLREELERPEEDERPLLRDALARSLLRELLPERLDEEEPRDFFVSPASARSLFTVRAAISSARRPWPRFS